MLLQVNDIRKAIEISPTKSKEIPILRKSSQPLILKKNVSSPCSAANTNVQGMPEEFTNIHLSEIHRLILNFLIIASKTQLTISSTNPPALNYRSRKVKVIRSPSSTNSKDMSLSSSATKLKFVEAYAAMLTEPKLSHFFKCMSYNCSYTTDSVTLYSQHYLQHYEEANKQNSTVSHNYEKCAYCYLSLNDWTSMKTHLWEKHSHCRYQCGYCFYRAIVPSYVQQHQVIIFTYYNYIIKNNI